MTWTFRHRLLGASFAWLLGATGAVGQEARRLSIPAQPMTTAVLQLGAQTGVSISALAAAGCGRSRAVEGRFRVEAALQVLLAGSGCTYRRLDRTTYLIVARETPPSPPPPRRPAPAPPLPVVPSELDDVIVTATRRELHLAGAPYALSSVDGVSFDAAARRDTSALATRLAGLTVTNLGPGRNKLFVRGLADSPLTGQTQAMGGLYLDETRLTYDAPDPDLRLVDLARVELLRGPQSTLYGSGTLGGVLKLISRPPVLDEYQGEIAAGLTFADDTSPGHSMDLVFNAPLLRDRLAVRTVLYEEVLEGVVDDPGQGRSNIGRTVRKGARSSLL
ncbi:MAG TPA: TonB-dependent receptor plug domain-containing protein, partial [Brevundimonas sp.]